MMLQSNIANIEYIHNKSYSAQWYIKKSDCALQKSTHVQINKLMQC